MQDTGNYYVINHVTTMTGLTDRTIRNYISTGILKGEKINGLWHFTPEQVEEFVRHPAVRPSILAKNNGIVYDFLLDDKKKSQEICMILDTPCVDKKEIAEYFCNSINSGSFSNIQFSYDGVMENVRVILKGNVADVLQLVNEFQIRYLK